MFARVILLALLWPTFAFATSSMKLLSFNVYMLPTLLKKSMQAQRSYIIPRQLSESDYDVMIFQEAFIKSFRDSMKSVLKPIYPYSYYMESNHPLVPFGSGNFVMSRYPFKVISEVYYKSCGGFDCFAAKGGLVIELTLPSGKVIQLAATHLQADGDNSKDRTNQLMQLKRALEKHARAGVPQILAGDLNMGIKPATEFAEGLAIMGMNYLPMMGEIHTTSSRVNPCYKTGANKRWIDHFWVTASSVDKISTMNVVNLEFPFKDKICPSSDHHAVEAHIAFKD